MGRHLGRSIRVIAATAACTVVGALHAAPATAEPLTLGPATLTVPDVAPVLVGVQQLGTALDTTVRAVLTPADVAPAVAASPAPTTMPSTSASEPVVTTPTSSGTAVLVGSASAEQAPSLVRAGARGMRPLLGRRYTAFLDDEGMRTLTAGLLGALAAIGALGLGWGGVLTFRDRRRHANAQTEWAARGSNPEPPG